MLFVTIIILCILGGAEIDLFLPSFPEIQTVFGLTPFSVELMLAVNLGTHCLFAFIAGNLGDRYGRKPVILSGLSLFILGSLFCVFAEAYWQVLFGRMLQGAGIAAPNVLAYVIIADAFSTAKQQKLLGVMNGVITLAMAFAPVLGSYVNLYYHWRGNFVALLVLAIISTLLGLKYLPQGQKNFDISISPQEYLVVFRSKKALYYIGSICFLLQAYWVFIGMAPILYMHDLQVTLKTFGFYQGTLAAVFSIISLTSAVLLKKYGQRICFTSSLKLLSLFVILALFLVVLGTKNPLLITGTSGILAAGMILPVNILYPLALESIPQGKGKISAVITALKFGLTAALVQMVSYVYNGTFFYVGIAMIGVLILAFIFGYLAYLSDRSKSHWS